MHSAYEPLLTPADKMPFEVEPVYLKLSYYKPPADAAATPAGAAPAAAAPAANVPQPAADPNAPAATPADAPPASNTAAPAAAASPQPQN